MRPDEPLAGQLAAVAVAMACPNGEADDPHELEKLLVAVDRASAVAVVLLPPDAKVAWGVLGRRVGKFVLARQDAEPAEILAKLDAAAALQPAFRNLQAELADARNIGESAGGQLKELDEEMRLAARLQRDFLPRRLPEVGSARFSVLYRPLGWVSGDIYDVARLDETHVGFYVADAVGHGMPAALLTMFIKRAFETKRIVGNTYEIIPPDVSLQQLNAAICEQNLSSCQFCTAAYCVLDVSTLRLTYARAGHPEPILIRADGSTNSLAVPGSLLGVFPGERYTSASVGLAKGDRVVLYSDGLEDALADPTGLGQGLSERLAGLRERPRDEMLLQLAAWIDQSPGGSRADDDVTVVVLDVG
jgi:serine phosphatase RsbU (regulator of sigma subunit)